MKINNFRPSGVNPYSNQQNKMDQLGEIETEENRCR